MPSCRPRSFRETLGDDEDSFFCVSPCDSQKEREEKRESLTINIMVLGML